MLLAASSTVDSQDIIGIILVNLILIPLWLLKWGIRPLGDREISEAFSGWFTRSHPVVYIFIHLTLVMIGSVLFLYVKALSGN